MRSFLCVLYLAHAVLAGDLYSPQAYSPVGIAYSAAPVVPQPIAPLHYASPLRTSVGYGPLAAARFNQVAHIAAPAPLAAPAPVFARTSLAAPAPLLAQAPAPIAYSAAPPVVTKYGAASTVLNHYAAVPAVADVPITRYEASPGFIQKYVDVAHPKLATTKIQIRRPAIQKQFYDIEERIVVRPVASAVVELDQPFSKTQGPTLVSPAVPAYPAGAPIAPVPISSPVPIAPLPPSPAFGPSAPPSPPPPPNGPQNPQNQFPSEINFDNVDESSDDGDSITVENVDARARSRSQDTMQNVQSQQPHQQSQPQPEERSQNEEEQPQTEQSEQPQARTGPAPVPQQPESQTQARFLSRSQFSQFNNNIPQSRAFQIADVIPSSRTSLTEEQSQANQQRLIELLTSRGGVEVRSGVSVEAAGEAGQIRGRVLSVTPAPRSSEPTDERVSTRRVVVSRPIQTLQEVNVVQPFTKLQRLSVQQPALLKTARVDIARVKTLAPVPVTSYAAPYAPYPYVH